VIKRVLQVNRQAGIKPASVTDSVGHIDAARCHQDDVKGENLIVHHLPATLDVTSPQWLATKAREFLVRPGKRSECFGSDEHTGDIDRVEVKERSRSASFL